MQNIKDEYSRIAGELEKIASQQLKLREAKKNLQKSPEFVAAKKQSDLQKKAFWNKAHNTAVKLFRDMPESEMASLKKAVSKDSIVKIDTILSAIKSYQAKL